MDNDNDLTYRFIEAVESSGTSALSEFLAQGVDVNAPDKYGRLAIVHAARKGRGVRHLEFLIENGADVNKADEHGETALMPAAVNEEIAMMNVLIEHGADLNAQDAKGRSALYQVAAFGKFSSLRALIKAGANVDVPDNEGNTPLMASLGRLDVVKILVEAGADVNVSNNAGKTALVRAEEYVQEYGVKHQALVTYLRQHSTKSGRTWIGKILSLFSSQDAAISSGWRLTEKWESTASLASPQLSSQREEISAAIDAVKKDILAREDIRPFGGYIVFQHKENADTIAKLLKKAGCPTVMVEQVRYNAKSNTWSP